MCTQYIHSFSPPYSRQWLSLSRTSSGVPVTLTSGERPPSCMARSQPSSSLSNSQKRAPSGSNPSARSWNSSPKPARKKRETPSRQLLRPYESCRARSANSTLALPIRRTRIVRRSIRHLPSRRRHPQTTNRAHPLPLSLLKRHGQRSDLLRKS